MVTWPATSQKMFFARATPLSVICAAAMLKSFVVWKIQTSFAPPSITTFAGMVTVLVHL